MWKLQEKAEGLLQSLKFAAEENGPGLDRCATEQVQIIGQIQPYGCPDAMALRCYG
jgi:hypothetical protein